MKTKRPKKKTSVAVTPEDGAGSAAVEGFKKEYSKDGSACLVTFWLVREAAPEAKQVALAGTFNQWNENSHLMTRLKTGDFTLTVELEAGEEYEFRYLIDGTRWENAWSADKYAWSDYAGCEHSVVVT